MFTGALDKICGYGGDIRNNWRSVGARKQIHDIAESRKYPVGAREKMCAAECDIYVHCFQVQRNSFYFGSGMTLVTIVNTVDRKRDR